MTENHWFLILLQGIFFLILGIFAISQPFLMTLSIEFFLGILLLAVGLAQTVRAIVNWGDSHRWMAIFGGLLALIAGALILTNPTKGALTLTFLITVFLALDGISKIVSSFQYRPIEGWGWLLFSGALSLILAGLIYSGWPTSAGWLIGLYVGIYLLFLGSSLIVLSFYVKKEIK